MSKILLLSALALCGTTLCQTAAATEYGTMVTAAAGVEMKWFCFTPALGIVIPAQAGIQAPRRGCWIPACAGTTVVVRSWRQGFMGCG